MKLSNFENKGNVAAIVLVLMLVVIAISVFMYQPFIPEEEAVNYGELLTDVRSAMDRGVQETFQTSLQTGLGAIGGTGVIYWNKAFRVEEDEITSSIEEDIGDHILQLEFEGGTIQIALDEIDGSFNVTLEDEGLRVNMQNASVTVEENGETRVVNLEDEYVIPSDLKNTLESVNTWLECDAGGLTAAFEEFHKDRPCQFRECCCSGEDVSEEDITNLVRDYGIHDENVTDFFQDSVVVLNNLLSGAETCSDAHPDNFTGDLREDYQCNLDMENSIVATQNDFVDLDYIDYSKSIFICDNPSEECALNPAGIGAGLLTDVNANQIDWNDSELEGRTALPNTGVNISDPAYPKYNENVDGDNLPTEGGLAGLYLAVGSDKVAEGDMQITCRNPNQSIADTQEFSFNMKFKNKYSCTNGDVSPDEVDADLFEEENPLACKASGGGPDGTEECTSQNAGTTCPNFEEEFLSDEVQQAIEDKRDEWGSCFPEDFTCAVQDEEAFCTLSFITDGSGEVLGDPADWTFPGHGDECGACGTCNQDGDCTPEPAAEGIVCEEFGILGMCGQYVCDGSGVTSDACALQPFDTMCGSGVCTGECLIENDEGVCMFEQSNGDSCEAFYDSCQVDGACEAGSCMPENDFSGQVCCGDSVCGSDEFCCAEAGNVCMAEGQEDQCGAQAT